MPDRSKEYAWGAQEPFTRNALDRRFLDINSRVFGIELLRLSEDEAYQQVLDRVLSRSEGVISDLRSRLLAITELEWLTATSTTSVTLVEAGEAALLISEDQRGLFAPGPFAVMTRISSPDDYAVVKTLGYDRESGQWAVRIEAFTGSPGPHEDWLISAIAGSALAQYTLLGEARAIRDFVLEARNQVLPAAAAVAADAQAVETARQETDADAQAAEAARLAAQGFATSIDPAAINRSIGAARSFAIAVATVL